MRLFQRLYFSLLMSRKERVRFYRKLALMLMHGITLFTALRHLHRQAEAQGKGMRHVLRILLRKLACGESFSQSLAPFAGSLEILLIEAFERDNLAKGLSEAEMLLREELQLEGKVLRSLSYPLFLLCLTCMLFGLIGQMLVPALLEVVPEDAWQGSAALLLLFHRASQGWGIVVVALMLVFVIILLPLSLPRVTGSLRSKLEHVFPWNFYRLLIGSSWLLSFSALLAQGIQAQEILAACLASPQTSPYLRERVRAIAFGLRNGKNLGEAFAESPFAFPSRGIVEDLRLLATLPGFEEEMQSIAREALVSVREQMALRVQRCAIVLLLIVAFGILCVLQGLGDLEAAFINL